MANRETNINIPVQGLNKDTHPSNLDSTKAYTFALNARQESEDGNNMFLSNDSSNTLGLYFPKDYVVIGQRNLESYQTVYFLVNPLTGDSEIGIIINDESKCIDNIDNIEDVNCDPCNEIPDEPKLGENIKFSTNSCLEYKTLINDKCLNFSIEHPIHKIDYKVNNQTTEIYWTDNYNKMRWIDINNIPKNTDGSLNCNQINIFPDYEVPCIQVQEEELTGSLVTGVYQFFVAYANSKGEELSQYHSATNPASIWENKPSVDLSYRTNKSLRITISNLDTTFRYFNLAVAKTIDNTTTFELVGFYDILTELFEFTYTGNDPSPRLLTANDIFFQQPVYTKAETLAVQNNILMFGGLETPETINYQSVANNIVLGWVDSIIPYTEFESYKTAENTANYRSYLRDEVYAFEFVPLLKSGRYGPRVHIPGRKSTPIDWEEVNNEDRNNFTQDPCDDVKKAYRWQLYNTAQFEGYTQEYINNTEGDCYKGTYRYGTLGYYESERKYPNNPKLWGELANQPIRHHKMPSVQISPIFDENPNPEDINYQHKIYPLGIRIDHQNILEAIEKSDLTQEQKDDIVGFQIVRATRTGNNSITAKGLFFNVGEYTRNNETYFFPNYSYNDVGLDPFLSKEQPTHHSGTNSGSMVWETQRNDMYYNPLNNSGDTRSLSISLPSFNTGTIVDQGNTNNPGADQSYGILATVTINGVPNIINFAFYSRFEQNTGGGVANDRWYIEPATLPSNQGSTAYFIDISTQVNSSLNTEYLLVKFPIRINVSNIMYRDRYTCVAMWFKIDRINNTLILDTNLELGDAGTNDVFETTPFTFFFNGGIENGEFAIMRPFKKSDLLSGPDAILRISEAPFSILVYEKVQVPSPKGDIRLNAFNLNSKSRYTFHGPNVHFNKPSLGGYVKMESIYSGKTKATLTDVLDESKYAISTRFTVKMASAMAVSTIITMTLGAGTMGWPNMSFGVDRIAPTFIQTLEMLEKLIPLKEYALQYLSIGNYSKIHDPEEGNMIRGLDIAGYLNPTIQAIGDINPINNHQRESCVYLRTINPLEFPHIASDAPRDNSKFTISSYYEETNNELKPKEKVYRDISSYYGSIKTIKNDQYGDIYSYRTVSTGQCFKLDRSNRDKKLPALYGGDTFINRFALKRKLPFFLDNRVGFPDKSDVAYDLLGNIAYPTYWLSTFPIETKLSQNTLRRADAVMREVENFQKAGNILKNFVSGGSAGMFRFVAFSLALGRDIYNSLGVKNTNFDNFIEEDIYELGYFYMFSYGIPYFFVESDVNTDLRQMGVELDQNYFPNVSTDIPEFWLQEKNVSINKDNFYLYNRDFSKQNLEGFYKTLDRDFDPDKINIDKYPTRVIYSETSSVEERQNNWLIYKANNYYDFPLTNGKLVDLNALDEAKVLARFENNSLLYNAYVQIETDNKIAIVGTGSMFSTPPQEYSNAYTGYLGTQHKSFISNKYGYYYVDAKRGEIFHLASGQGGVDEISRKGMKNWFKENLPFHITKYFRDVPTDNIYKNIGIAMGWDNRYERLFVSKKDFIPKDDRIYYKDGKFWIDEVKIKKLRTNRKICSPGYTYNAITDLCEKNETIEGTPSTSPIYNATDVMYGMWGAWVYNNTLNPGTATPITTSFWLNRVNLISKWINPDGSPYDTPVSFSFCINVNTSKELYVGLTGDNLFTVYLDNEVIFTNLTLSGVDFRALHIIPVYLTAGSHKISMTVINQDVSSPGAIAAEIYDNSFVQLQNAVSIDDLNILFSTETQTSFPQLDFTCPEGYTLKEDPHQCGVFYCERVVTLPAQLKEVITEIKDIKTIEVHLDDDKYFADASWTMSYRPDTQSWVSWHSFKPNYYVEQIGYFQTGIHNRYQSSLWNHNLTNKSYQIYYNKFYSFDVECLTKPDILSNTVQSIAFDLDVYRYTNLHNYKLMQNITFDEAEISNDLQTSGILKLKLQDKKELYSNLIATVGNRVTNINISKVDQGFKFNRFYDIVKDKNSNTDIHLFDAANVTRTINPISVDYNKTKELFNTVRIKSDVNKVMLRNTTQSRYKYIYKWLINKTIKSIR